VTSVGNVLAAFGTVAAAVALVLRLVDSRHRRQSAARQRELRWPVVPHGVTAVEVPSLGLSVTSVRVLQVSKRPGDLVVAGEPLVELSTDKVDVELPSAIAGVVTEVFVKERDDVSVGFPILAIRRQP
jgi:biotin carboxyl carrier protein